MDQDAVVFGHTSSEYISSHQRGFILFYVVDACACFIYNRWEKLVLRVQLYGSGTACGWLSRSLEHDQARHCVYNVFDIRESIFFTNSFMAE